MSLTVQQANKDCRKALSQSASQLEALDTAANEGDLKSVSIGKGDDKKSLGLTFQGEPIAILRDVEIFEHRKEERAARTFGLTHEKHPYIENCILFKCSIAQIFNCSR